MDLPIHLIVGSEQGNTEYLANELSDLLSSYDHQVTCHEQPQYGDIPRQDCIWIVITATFGAGEYPANIQPFVNDLTKNQPNLSAVEYAVIAVGDKSYDTFCQSGRDIDDLLGKFSAKKQYDRLEMCVNEHDDPLLSAFEWIQNWLN